MITTTNKDNTFSGWWPMTKENTYYGYQVGNEYHWYKNKTTIKNHLKGTNKPFYRGTLIKDKMFINTQYLTMDTWR